MPGDTYPKFRAAAVQAAPVFLDRDKTIEKVEQLVKEAASKGAELIVFSESFIPAFPVWNNVILPIDQHAFFRRMFDNSVEIPSPQFYKLAEIARSNHVYLSVGITEKGNISMGTLWNTNLLFNPEGELINRHRKLVPTWVEKLTWAYGDASHLEPVQTDLGRIGTLICGENTNTLSRFSLLAQGEQVHISTYPPAYPFQRPETNKDFNLAGGITVRAAAHSFEGKVFNIVSAGLLDEDAINQVAGEDETIKFILENSPKPVSMIVGPTGEVIGEPLVGVEGIVYADIDLSESIVQKQLHDIVGHYNRFDIYELKLNKRPQIPIEIKKVKEAEEDSEDRSWNLEVKKNLKVD